MGDHTAPKIVRGAKIEVISLYIYSHYLFTIGLYLNRYAELEGQDKTNQLIVDLKLNELGWSPVKEKEEDEEEEEEEEEDLQLQFKCCRCYGDVRLMVFWGCDFCGLSVCKDCATNEEGVVHCGHSECERGDDEDDGEEG